MRNLFRVIGVTSSGVFRLRGAALVLTYMIYAATAAACLATLMPPFQNADEMAHFLRADHVTRGHLVGQRLDAEQSGGIASPEIVWAEAFVDVLPFHPDRRVTRTMLEADGGRFRSPGELLWFRNTAIYPPIFYAPPAMALWIGKAGRMSVIKTLYLARLLTALASGVLISAALCVCLRNGQDGAALAIFVLATLPMSLSLQSAVSQDGPMLGAAALAAALFARLRVRSAGGSVGLCACLGAVAMARPAYGFLALVPLATPLRWRVRWAGAALVGLACLAWCVAASHAVVTPSDRGADPQQQFSFMLDPGHDWDVLSRTLQQFGALWLVQFVGQLGWLDVALPPWLIALALCVLAMAAVAGLHPFGRGLLVILATLLSALGVLALLYLSWNSPGAPTVEGVQGRYFLPLAMMLAGLGGKLRPGIGPIAWGAALALPAVSLGVTIGAIVNRYYLT